MTERIERFTFPSQYRQLAHIDVHGEVVVDMNVEDLEQQTKTAWDLQHRALARLILEIARLRLPATESAVPTRDTSQDLARDAARYRWIRQHGAWETEALLNSLQPEEYDELVDRIKAENP